MPQKETLDRAAYTCMLVSYRRLPPQFQFSLSGVTLVYLSQWYARPPRPGAGMRFEPEPVFVNVFLYFYTEARESIPPTYVAWRAGTSNRVFVPARQAGN